MPRPVPLAVLCFLAVLAALSRLPGATLGLLGPPSAHGVEVDPDVAARLDALGYVEQVTDDPDPQRVGVTHHDPRAFPGVNYHCTGQSVRFIDMTGKLVLEVPLEMSTGGDSGCLAKPYRPGLMAVVRSPFVSLSGLDKNDRWYREGSFHHDVASDDRGRLYTFARHDATLTRGGREVPIMDQAIVVLDGKGRLERAIDLQPLFERFVPDARIDAIAKESATPRTADTRERYVRTTDVFHPNSIELVAWPPGTGRRDGTHALIALRDLDRIAIVDLVRQRLVWEWGADEIIGPHDPWLLENGHVLVFDNGARPIGARQRAYSRVVEVNPADGTIVWQYPKSAAKSFFSPTRGGAQPLPNGNVLITETTSGHVFEVTRDGELVWDFWNPDFRSEDGLRRTIYRMRRMSLDEFDKLRRQR